MLNLVIDQGGSSSRAIVFNAYGEIISQGQIKVATFRNGNMIEQNPDEVCLSITRAIEQCLKPLSVSQIKQLKAVGLVCQRSSFIAINTHTKQALTAIISWQDTRAAKRLHALKLDEHKLKQLTGLPLSAHYGASKMLWCLENITEVKQAADIDQLMFLPLAAYLSHFLTSNSSKGDNYLVDPVSATRTFLFSGINPEQNTPNNTFQWSRELLTSFRIKAQWLPNIVPSNYHLGDIKIAINKHKLKLPLTYLNGDQSAALFAYGAIEENTIQVNIGSGAFVNYLLPSASATSTKAISEKGLLHSLVAIYQTQTTPKFFHAVEGTINGAGSAIDVMAQQLAIKHPQKLTIYPAAQSNIPIFINTIGGLAAPFWRSDINSVFMGEGDNEAKMIAVYESIIFLISYLIERIISLQTSPNNLPKTNIQISGGLANNLSICQLLADVTGLIVKKKQDVEATSLGAAFYLAGQPKNWLMALTTKTFTPQQSQQTNVYSARKAVIKRYQMWQNHIEKLTANQ